MIEPDDPPAEPDPAPSAAGQPDADAEAVGELMDQVAALLKSQMRAANQRIRKGAAWLLDPAWTRRY